MIHYFMQRPVLFCLIVTYITLAIGVPMLWAIHAIRKQKEADGRGEA